MKTLIHKYKIDNHIEVNKSILNIFDMLPNNDGSKQYNLGVTKYDGHNHITSPFIPTEWQWMDPLNSWSILYQDESNEQWDKLVEKHNHLKYKKILLDAVKPALHEHAKSYIKEDITGIKYKHNIMHMWFHQMTDNDYTFWENHQYCQWSAIYFVEISDKKYVTEFLNPDNDEIIQPDVSEGDLVIFPSYVLHRAPKILNGKRKTTISWNMDIHSVYTDDQLNKLKQTHPNNWYK